jgi:hypothetical protein
MPVTYSAQQPIVQSVAGQTGVVPLRSFTASSTCHDGDIVVLSAGAIAPATANVATGIAGVAAHDSRANYGGEANAAAYAPQDVFGISQVGTLLPLSPGQTLVAQIITSDLVVMNLTATTGWVSGGSQQANIGTLVGLAIDGTTGNYVADPTASNKVAIIVSKPLGPFAGGADDVGNLGAPVGLNFLQASLV